jgi:uncharacterized protein (DUF934 family)
MRFIDPARDEWPAADTVVTPNGRPALLTWAQWEAAREAWPEGARVGVVLPNTVDVEDLHADLPRWSLVALQFPKWTDGRAYSQARLLRARLRFNGEIRATGEVLVDMLPLLQRSGFSAVQLRVDQSLESAQRALRFFASHYQGDVLEPHPRFARRAA